MIILWSLLFCFILLGIDYISKYGWTLFYFSLKLLISFYLWTWIYVLIKIKDLPLWMNEIEGFDLSGMMAHGITLLNQTSFQMFFNQTQEL